MIIEVFFVLFIRVLFPKIGNQFIVVKDSIGIAEVGDKEIHSIR